MLKVCGDCGLINIGRDFCTKQNKSVKPSDTACALFEIHNYHCAYFIDNHRCKYGPCIPETCLIYDTKPSKDNTFPSPEVSQTETEITRREKEILLSGIRKVWDALKDDLAEQITKYRLSSETIKARAEEIAQLESLHRYIHDSKQIIVIARDN